MKPGAERRWKEKRWEGRGHDHAEATVTEKRKVEENDFCGKYPCSHGRGFVVDVAT